MTLVLLALDGLDAGLIDHFDIEKFRLNTHSVVEPFVYQKSGPFTLEIWPTVATGLHPRKHGVTGKNSSDWDNPILEVASKFTSHLDGSIRTTLGHFAQDKLGADYDIPETDVETMFDREGRVVHNWPGVVNSKELRDVWRMTNMGYSQSAFEREVFGKAAEQFGWAREMLNHDVSLAAVHVHAPDVFGHAYSEDEENLRRTYERIAEYVTEIEDALGNDDDLVVLSDHGIQTAWLDPGKEPGPHSERAFGSTTLDSLPEDMFEVREWVEDHVTDVDVDEPELDLPKEQLRQLGYIE